MNLPSSTFGYFGALLNKDDQASRIYPEICNKHGTNQTDPEGVAGAFADFYEDTYRFFRIRTLMLLLRRIFPIVNPTLKTNTRHWTKLYIII